MQLAHLPSNGFICSISPFCATIVFSWRSGSRLCWKPTRFCTAQVPARSARRPVDEHPLAGLVASAAKEWNLSSPVPFEVEATPGSGISARYRLESESEDSSGWPSAVIKVRTM